jgi:archaeosine synthase beta-subunit
MTVTAAYPAARRHRDRFVLARRGTPPARDPWRHQGVLLEDERASDGRVVQVATIFLTGRECPWRCVMCDLWQYTIAADTPPGALLRQLDDALEGLARDGAEPLHVKLYNASNFFDPRAVPERDYDALAERLLRFQHVIVESHPTLIGRRVPRFIDALVRAAHGAGAPTFEIAMGLETSHPAALDRLNKGFTVPQFARAADRVRLHGAALRVFLLVGVPFVDAMHQQEWLARSLAFAFDCGASAVSLIPTRRGNGALEALDIAAPTLGDLESALELALADPRVRVFADLWNLERFASCAHCFSARRERLHMMNLEQRVRPAVACTMCARLERPVA